MSNVIGGYLDEDRRWAIWQSMLTVKAVLNDPKGFNIERDREIYQILLDKYFGRV